MSDAAPVQGLRSGKTRTAQEETVQDDVGNELPLPCTTTWPALPAARDLEPATIVVFIQLQLQDKPRKWPNWPVDACCAQSRYMIYRALLWWSAADTSSATIAKSKKGSQVCRRAGG
jgi:hypothetical protein